MRMAMDTRRQFVLAIIAILASVPSSQVQAQAEQRTGIKAVLDLIFSVGKDFYFEGNGVKDDFSGYDCPLCDSSVYSYCSEKLLHDACCCLNPYEHRLPRQCRYADCSFLHANSCDEHKLITACCCSQPYRF